MSYDWEREKTVVSMTTFFFKRSILNKEIEIRGQFLVLKYYFRTC
jgi:hypothetical protein